MPEIQWFWYGAELVKDVEVSQTVTNLHCESEAASFGIQVTFCCSVANL